jgi:hypothetical protein
VSTLCYVKRINHKILKILPLLNDFDAIYEVTGLGTWALLVWISSLFEISKRNVLDHLSVVKTNYL